MRFQYLLTALFVTACVVGHPVASAAESVERHEIKTGWTFQQESTAVWYPAQVPGCVHTDLLSNGLIPDPYFGTNEQRLQWIGEKNWMYRTTFDLPAETLQRDSIELLFKGLDTYARVYLNDSLVVNADNMFRQWRRPCKPLLKQQGNVLVIRFRNVFDETVPKYKSAPYLLQAGDNNDQADVKVAPYSRKAQFHYGWDWGPRLVTCGIWRPVVLEAWSDARIQDVRVQQDNVSRAGATITSVLEVRSSTEQDAAVHVSMDSLAFLPVKVHLHQGMNSVTIKQRLDNPKLWWTNGLGSQHLYHYRAGLATGAGHTDEYTTRIGIRSLEIVRGKDSLGTSLYVRLNGVPVFMKGADYIPMDNFQSRVTPERYEFMIGSAAKANMNMLRVWGGGIFEDDRFYEACDEHGILLWHDMMFACAMYPSDSTFLENVRQEVLDNVRRIRNHPSLALYCGNNENQVGWHTWGWKQQYAPEVQAEYEQSMKVLYDQLLPETIREADPTRYYQPSSPGAGYLQFSNNDGDIHYWGVWHGKEPFENFEKNIARFVTEYGFQSYPQFQSVEKFTEPKDRELHSDVMLSHQRCMSDARKDKEYGNRLIKAYMDRMMREPKDFASYLYASQVLQAEGITMGIEAHRRAMPKCMGSLYWQINDCWPVASWSSIDYYGDWKALQYYAKRRYEQTIIAPRSDSSSVQFYVVSDRPDGPMQGILHVRAVDFAGKELFARVFPVTIKPNASDVYAVLERKELTGGNDESRLVILSTLTVDSSQVAEDLTYLVPLKDLKLEHPEIQVNVVKGEKGNEVTLTSNTLAKDVYLSVDGGQGLFSDNYFDLLPGVAKRVQWSGKEPAEGLQGKIRVMSLADTY